MNMCVCAYVCVCVCTACRCANGLTWVSRPTVTSIVKKQTDHSGAAGIIATASGYAMNAKPGPTTHTHAHTHTHTHTHIHSVTSLIMTMLLLLCIFMDTGWHYMRPQHWLIHRCMHIWCINNIDEFSVDNSLQKCREIQKIQQLRDSVNHWVSDGSNAVVQTIVFVSHFCK